MRWITSLRSLFFHQQSFQFSIVRSLSKTVQAENNLQENPYFEKYANKIAELEQRSPEELNERLGKNTKEVSNIIKQSSQKTDVNKENKISHFQNKKDLNQIMKIDSLQDKNASEIENIWKEYHQLKDGVFAVLPSESFRKMKTNLNKYPVFLFPLPRANGYEFITCQHLDQSCYFTSLVNYQAFKENAPVCLTITYFTELMESKGIVLMRGEYDSNAIKVHEAQCLANQLHLYYGDKDNKKLQLVEQFNLYPSSFKHMDLIANLEYGLGN